MMHGVVVVDDDDDSCALDGSELFDHRCSYYY
jgi:hypothetical protein